MEGNCLMHTGFPFGVMEMFWNWIKMIVAQYDEYSKCYRIIHVKMVNFMLCEFYFTKKKKKNGHCSIISRFCRPGTLGGFR